MLCEYISTLIASSIAVTHAFTPHLPCPVNWHFRGANEQRSTVHFSGTNMPTVISMKKPILYFLQNKQGKKWHISVRENTLISQIVTGYFFDKWKIKYWIRFCKHSQGKPNQQMHDNLLHIMLVSASWERLNTVRRVLQIHIKGVLLCSTHSRRA